MMMCCVWAMCSCGQTTPSEGEITLNGTLAGLELVSENDEVVLRISGTKEDIYGQENEMYKWYRGQKRDSSVVVSELRESV